VLLAAGESRRMRAFKQLLPIGEKSFVESCVENILDTGRIAQLVVVTGRRSEEVRQAIKNREVRIVYNPDYRSGMSGSIKKGIESISASADAVLIALVDQPHIGAGIIKTLIDSYENPRPLVAVPTFNGKRGHPIIVSMALKGEILAMDPEQGLRSVIRAHDNEVMEVEIGSEAVLKDFDYPEDYMELSR
jgi:molybdenum cofactor cytidylyltransferase